MPQIPSYKPRSPRILGSSLQGAIFTLDDHPTLELKVQNISASGLAVKGFNLDKNLGSSFKAKLAIDNLDLALNMILVRRSANNVAFMFEPAPYQLANFILQCFPYELRGQKLIKVSAENLKSNSFGEPNWYYDGRENELYFLNEGDKVVYFRISLNGKYIEYYPGYPMQVRRYDSKASNMQKPGTRTVDEVITLSDENINNIVRFVEHIRFLDREICREILSSISNSKAV